MLKTHIFALGFLLMFIPGMTNTPTTMVKETAPIATATAVKAPSAFRSLSRSDMTKLGQASAAVSPKSMAKKGEIAKDESTFTWHYLLIFAVIALGAAITLLVI